MNMIVQQCNSKLIIKHINNENNQNFYLNIDKIYNLTGWKPSISIWDGISMLLQEEKFKNPNTFDNFTKTIRTLYR